MRELLLDACVMINLAASGLYIEDIARRNKATFVMARTTATEVLYLATEDGGEPYEPIDVPQYVRDGELTLVDLTPEELVSFMTLARSVDDGEAAMLALAMHRGWAIATDDRKARRVARESIPNPELTTTAAILHRWATGADAAPEDIRGMLRKIETKAAYTPRRTDRYREWWTAQVTERRAFAP